MTTSALDPSLENHPVVSSTDWLTARRDLLKKEQELATLSDEISRQRRALPWERVDKIYVFDGPNGPVTLADLFAGRSQLIVYHFMFGPGWQEGCVGCSFVADHVDGARQHLEQNDVSFAAISRAPFLEIEAFRQRMGWRFKWVSADCSEFNSDYHVSFSKEALAKGPVFYNFEPTEQDMEEVSGISIFYRNSEGEIFHTYSAYSRGVEAIVGTYHYLDLTPKGRHDHADGDSGNWLRHHDRYGAGGTVDSTGRYIAPEKAATCCHPEEAGV